MNLQQHLTRYFELVKQSDELFSSLKQTHAGLVRCRPGCDDCCRVFFQLSLIEAFAVSGMFRRSLTPDERARVLLRAEKAEPLFREAVLLFGASQNVDEAAEAAARVKIPCPMNETGTCLLYDHRPITCRLYGVPQKTASKIVSCPLCGFEPGRKYVTVDVERINSKLERYSEEFLRDMIGLDSKGYLPVFLITEALTTDFNREYFLSIRDSVARDSAKRPSGVQAQGTR